MSEKPKQEEKISVCDIMKEDTSEIIRKLESQTPVLIQNYSDLYIEYLHMLDDIFGTCYTAEKEFYDKLNINQEILKQIKNFSGIMKKNYIDNIDMTSKFFNQYMQIRKDAIKSYDDYIHTIMNSYAKMWSQYYKATSNSQ